MLGTFSNGTGLTLHLMAIPWQGKPVRQRPALTRTSLETNGWSATRQMWSSVNGLVSQRPMKVITWRTVVLERRRRSSAMLPTVFLPYTDPVLSLTRWRTLMLKTALRQSEKKLQKQIAKTKVSLRMSKRRHRIWSMMRKAIDEADIPGKAKTLGDTFKGWLGFLIKNDSEIPSESFCI